MSGDLRFGATPQSGETMICPGMGATLRRGVREAGAVFRVGPNAFQKYERGLIAPSGPTAQLMRLLDRHPELVEELRE